MEKKIKISIITPVFNGEKFIKDVIDNIKSQNYENYEHIIIDGGSRDNTVKIIEENKHTKLKYISEKDNGQSDALNKGFKMASGEVITWLCADDLYVDTSVLAKVANYFQNEETNIIYGRCKLLDLETNEESLIPQNAVTEEDLIRWWNWAIVPPQPAIFFRDRILKEAGYLDASLNYCMDHDLWLKFLKNGHEFKLVDDIFAIYRVHPDSKTGSQTAKFVKEHDKVGKRYWGSKLSLRYYIRFLQYFYARYYKFKNVFEWLKK